MSVKRIAKELALIVQDPIEGIEIIQSDDNISHWDLNIQGTVKPRFDS
jgi:ubiquitin-protein ligase